MTRSPLRDLLLPGILLCLAVPCANRARAGDGVLEINQACATQTGCFAGDAVGFPVSITTPASYRLTSNLEPGGADGIVVESFVRVVTIDLNGFRIRGPGSGTGVGVRGQPSASAISIRNGHIQEMGGDGIRVGGSTVIESVHLLGNLGDGIEVSETSIVRDARIIGNGGYGIRFSGPQALYSGIVFAGNALGSVLNGRAGGGNLCDDALCSSLGRKRFYLTPSRFDGANADAPGVCAPGFHFASYFELADPSNLSYEGALGVVRSDPGPPLQEAGWIQTGGAPDASNCSGWASTSTTGVRMQAVPPGFGLPDTPWPWDTTVGSCGGSAPVWCAEN